jgi:hypothetical protein
VPPLGLGSWSERSSQPPKALRNFTMAAVAAVVGSEMDKEPDTYHSKLLR